MSTAQSPIAQSPVAGAHVLQAPVLPPHRIREAREIAVESGWFAGCPDRRCRERKDCVGKLRRVGEGPRCYPGCLGVALAALLDPNPAPETLAAFHRVLADDDAFWAGADDPDGTAATAAPSAVLLTVLLGLAELGRREAAAPQCGASISSGLTTRSNSSAVT